MMSECELSACKIENLIDYINSHEQLDSASKFKSFTIFIDELNAYCSRNNLNVSAEKLDSLLRTICLKVPPENSLTVAKYCQLLLNLNTRNKLELSDSTLAVYTERLIFVLEARVDISYLDVLQVIRILVTNHTEYYSKGCSRLIEALVRKLEEDVTLVDAQAIKLYRLHCILDLASCMCQEDSKVVVEHLINVIYSQDSSNPIFMSKVWTACLEVITRILNKAKEVKDVPRLVGAIVSALKLGLGAARPGASNQKTAGPQKPDIPPSVTPLYPTPLPPFPPDNDTDNSKNKNSNKVGNRRAGGNKWKSKSGKEVEWCGDESFASWPCDKVNSASDSDVSDSESGRRAREFAKTRYIAAHAIVHIVKILDRKVMSGYYNLLLGPTCLQESLMFDSMIKPKVAAVVAVKAVLIQAKPYLALAQYSDSKSFTAYCESLSELLVSLHNTLFISLSCGGGHHAMIAILHCLSTLATVCPYHRLKPGLITKVLSVILPHLHSTKHKEAIAALECLSTFLSLENQTQELKQVTISGPPGSALSFSKSRSSPWITALCLMFLQKDGVESESLRISHWDLLSSLATHHFDTCIFSDLPLLEELIISTLSDSECTSEIHIAVLQTLAVFFEQLSSKEEYGDECIALWNRLLTGPLIPFLQDTTATASHACEVLSLINQQCFYAIPEKRQIGLMTLVYGCCYHDQKSVRASAVKVLGVLLNFPNMANETYLYDIVNILLKAASDSSDYCRLRASWAFGNLADLLRTMEPEILDEISLIKLIDSCLLLSKDAGSIKVNLVRALGALLSLVRVKDMEDPVYREALDKTTALLVKSTSSGIYMKVRWNACHAISHILANEALYLHTSNWFDKLVKSLCSLLIKSNHFKVRSNACGAIRSIKKRNNFGHLYEHVWLSLLDGLDNSANMPNFKEYKQQSDLLNQLCMSICHVMSLLEEKDIGGIKTLLEYREENLGQFLRDFISRAPPELASVAIPAHSNLNRLGAFGYLTSALELAT